MIEWSEQHEMLRDAVRKFVEADSYFGPDRRLPVEGLREGRSDSDPVACENAGPTLSQSEIDSLLNFARNDPA